MVAVPVTIYLCMLCVAPAVADGQQSPESGANMVRISGIYPKLTVTNHSRECGIGAVVPWAEKLWLVTYSPHKPHGSDDRLYELDDDLSVRVRPESIGGTPANRMIHTESEQLIIGPYFIDGDGNVRVVPYSQMPGRPTATMRHLTDPANKVYFFGMEGESYEVDVHSLKVTAITDEIPVPGTHGKGGYTAQNRVVIANNGERGWWQEFKQDPNHYGPAGALAGWDGQNWQTIHRSQFCEVTGPGGIRGAVDDDAPLWSTGWDRKSVILKLLDTGTWHTFRLPKASHTYDGGHGWFTEWPRIRRINPDKTLMTMHGMFYDFPATFSADDTGGLRPICSYLKMVVDFCTWNDSLVFACNDTSLQGNPLAGQAQSNLWFGRLQELHEFGPKAGWGGPWLNDTVQANQPSVPYLFASFTQRVIHIAHRQNRPVTFTLQLDENGDGNWRGYKSITVPSDGYRHHIFKRDVTAEWIRIVSDTDCDAATAFFHYSAGERRPGIAGRRSGGNIFASLAPVGTDKPRIGGIVRPRGGDRGTLQFLAVRIRPDGTSHDAGYFEIDEDMQLRRVEDEEAARQLADSATVDTPDFRVDDASVIVTDHTGQRRRLPKADPAYDSRWPMGWPRGIREVVTERNLFNCHGTIYELPRPSAGGLNWIKPVCTHKKMITDFCSWRGLLVLAGTIAGVGEDGHQFTTPDGDVGLWFGNVDDLWQLGKPRGTGGPWKNTPVTPDEPSDPYLMTGYDHKRLRLANNGKQSVTFIVEVDFTGFDTWYCYDTFELRAGDTLTYEFPNGFNAHWVRIRVNKQTIATATFDYD